MNLEATIMPHVIKRCASCNAQIISLLTVSSRPILVDADTVGPQDTCFNPAKHRSHFVTCLNANRRQRKKQPGQEKLL